MPDRARPDAPRPRPAQHPLGERQSARRVHRSRSTALSSKRGLLQAHGQNRL